LILSVHNRWRGYLTDSQSLQGYTVDSSEPDIYLPGGICILVSGLRNGGLESKMDLDVEIGGPWVISLGRPLSAGSRWVTAVQYCTPEKSVHKHLLILNSAVVLEFLEIFFVKKISEGILSKK
jgi:hypothetical protein